MSIPKTQTVGVLGGMGPYATVEFLRTLLDETPASRDWDYVHTVVDSDVTIPSRTRHILFGEESPVDAMTAVCKKLQSYPCDLIVIPCNSASFFVPQIQPWLNVPILDIIQASSLELAHTFPATQSCLVVGARLTFKTESYSQHLNNIGVSAMYPSIEDQDEVESLIEEVKLTGFSEQTQERTAKLIESLAGKYPVDTVILACTELRVLNSWSIPGQIIDSTFALARQTLKYLGKAA